MLSNFPDGKFGFAAESSRELVVKGRTCFEDVWLSRENRVRLDFRGFRLCFEGLDWSYGSVLAPTEGVRSTPLAVHFLEHKMDCESWFEH